MCVIIHKPANISIDDTILRLCWDANKDGAGFMYSDNGKLIVKRGYMKYKRFKSAYLPVEDKEMVIHFRWASCGDVSPTMCHPFKVNEDLAMVHNGHIDIPYLMKDHESDTVWLVKNIFREFPKDFLCSAYNNAYHKIISMSIKGSVMVFMDNNSNVIKVGERGRNGMNFAGCWFSNGFWLMNKNVNIVNISQIKYVLEDREVENAATESHLQTQICSSSG